MKRKPTTCIYYKTFYASLSIRTEKSGLEVGDKILEVNNISLKGIASSTAVKVLTGSSRLKLVVQRTRKIPEWRLSREKTSWYEIT